MNCFEYIFREDAFRWSGSKFIPQSKIPNLFNYSSNIQGWTDELTQMHEDAAAGGHPIDVMSRTLTLSFLASISSYLNSGIILEIGSSSGYLIDDLVRRTNLNIMGSDVVNQPLLRLAQSYPSVPFVRCDVNDNPFSPESFSCVICLNVLEHIESDLKALRNINGILSQGGYLILELPFGKNLYDDFDKQLSHFRRYSTSDILQKSKFAGFEVVNVDYIGILIYPIFYFYKKFISKLKINKPKTLINNSSGLFFETLLKLERFLMLSNFLHFGIRIRIILRKI